MKNSAKLRKKGKRSRFRHFVGSCFFQLKRYIEDFSVSSEFTRLKQLEALPHSIFKHETPLFRGLRGVGTPLEINKVHNLSLAVERLNGIVLLPGETFSYWHLIGRPTRWKGYKKGMLLRNGNIEEGIGGGLCQLSNLIYWMTIHTPLTVTERWRHSYDVFPDVHRTQPFGSGATCSYNYVDLRIKNTTTYPYQLVLHVGDETLTGEWRSTEASSFRYEIFEKSHEIRSEVFGGYTRRNVIARRIIDVDDPGEVKEEVVAQNCAWMMYDPLIDCDNLKSH